MHIMHIQQKNAISKKIAFNRTFSKRIQFLKKCTCFQKITNAQKIAHSHNSDFHKKSHLFKNLNFWFFQQGGIGNWDH